MQRLSAANYPLTRNLVPQLKQRSVLIPAAVVSLLFIATGLWILLTPAIPLLLLITLIHNAPNYAFQNFCRDAWLDDDALMLQFKEEQLRIPFEQIEKVTWHGSNNPPRAKVWLRSATHHGTMFTFVPDLAKGRQQAKKNIEAIHEKVSS